MQVSPQSLIERHDLNLRQGIKSSLSSIRSIVALLYVLYVANNRIAKIQYSEEYDDHGIKKIRLNSALERNIQQFLSTDISQFQLNDNPLFKAQMEALQVGIELFLRLGKVEFADPTMVNAAERTGGNRFKKIIDFGTNIKIIDLYLSTFENKSVIEFLCSWLKNEDSALSIDAGMKQMLTIFSEETQFKLRTPVAEIKFQQEGIYKILEQGNTVISRDAHESVGPFRIFKSYVGDNLHPYIKDGANGFEAINLDPETKEYFKLVSNSLDLIPKRTTIYSIDTQNAIKKDSNQEWQKIIYGCPGTGKSYKIETEYTLGISEDLIFRTTFHPDSDYASFVGCYKPINIEGNISYQFIPQIFTDAYIAAWNNPEKKVYLIIEEINRGNCAQIFGDLFQLLDRNDDGTSTYKIKADKDLRTYLEQELPDSMGIHKGKLSLPKNLFILATMNTSDQSLFPLDSAFKRRWAWEHVPIDYSEDIASGKFTIEIGNNKYRWIDFLKKINDKIRDTTLSEDKQMGNFFIKKDIKQAEFVNKVMFYLWSEVCKDEYQTQKNFFRTSAEKEFMFSDLFTTDATQLLIEFMAQTDVKPITIDEQPKE